MKLKNTALAASTLLGAALLAIAAPLSASAHVDVEPSSAAAGSETVLTFSLPHGCDGSSTTAFGIGIPEGVEGVTPTVNPSWTVSQVPVDLASPISDGHGHSVTTRIGQIVYTAKVPLADGLRDTFALSLVLPEDAAGKTLEFPVLQTCEKGSTMWDQTSKPGEAEPEFPAPAVIVTAATADSEHGAATDASAGHDDASKAGAASGDALARVLGVGGLAVGAVGIVLAVAARRKQSA